MSKGDSEYNQENSFLTKKNRENMAVHQQSELSEIYTCPLTGQHSVLERIEKESNFIKSQNFVLKNPVRLAWLNR